MSDLPPGAGAGPVVVDGRRPLTSVPGTWWRVETGELHVFERVRWDDGEQSAPVRTCSVPAGAFLLRASPDATVTGVPGTTASPWTVGDVTAALDGPDGPSVRAALALGAACLLEVVADGPAELGALGADGRPGAEVVAELERLAAGLAPAEAAFVRAARQHADAAVVDGARADEAAQEASVGRLSAVIPHARRGAVETTELDADPLELALGRVGEAMGVRLVGTAEAATSPLEAARARARAAGVRSRHVRLEPAWWTSTSAPLIVLADGGRTPIAVIPDGGRHWDWVDPLDGTRHRVDATFAAGLDPVALAFVTPLPEGPVRFRDLAALTYGVGRRWLWITLAVALLGSLMALVAPVATQLVYGDVFPSGRRSLLLSVAAVLAAAGVSMAVLDLTRSLATLRIGGLVESVVLPAIWDRLLRLPATFFRRHAVGDLQSRLSGVLAAGTILSTGLVVATAATFSLVSFGVMFLYNATMAVVALVGSVLLIAMLIPLSVMRVRRTYSSMALQGAVQATEFQLLQAVPRLRVAGAEDRGLDAWAGQEAEALAMRWRIIRLTLAETVISTAMPVLLVAVLYAVAGAELVDASRFMGFMTALGLFSGALMGLYKQLDPLLRLRPIYQRLQPLLSEPIEDVGATVEPGALHGAVALDHVTFRYEPDGPLVLDDVSIAAGPGELIAVTGASGAGKSTILRLLLGFDVPEVGEALYDGKDLASLRKRSVRAQVGTVLQDVAVPPGPLVDAIIGDSDLSEEDAWQAAEAVGLAEDIQSMPMQMQTVVAPGSPVFSTGQLQRISIARAIARRPKVVLLDEATSALDNETQATVTAALRDLGTTRVVVAHRLSTIRDADRIYVLDGGRIAQAGTYDDLVDEPGVFRDLVARQLYEPPGSAPGA